MSLPNWLPEIPAERRVADPRDYSSRSIPLSYIVCHTTGSGVIAQAQAAGKTAPHDIARFACEFYARGGNNVSTHLLVDWEGLVWQILPLNVDGWHSGWDAQQKTLYASDAWQQWSHPVNGNMGKYAPVGDYATWKSLFPGKTSPAQLLPAGATSPNKGSISIDLLACPYGKTWTPEQVTAFKQLVASIKTQAAIAHVYPHSYLDPITRMTQTVRGQIIEKTWDPPEWEVALKSGI